MPSSFDSPALIVSAPGLVRKARTFSTSRIGIGDFGTADIILFLTVRRKKARSDVSRSQRLLAGTAIVPGLAPFSVAQIGGLTRVGSKEVFRSRSNHQGHRRNDRIFLTFFIPNRGFEVCSKKNTLAII